MKVQQLLLTALALGAAGSLSAQVIPMDIEFDAKALSLRRTVEADVIVFANPGEGFFPWTGGFWEDVFLIAPEDVVLEDGEGTMTTALPLPLFASDENRDGFADMVFTFDVSELLADETRRTVEMFTLTVTKFTIFGPEVYQGSTTIKIR